MASSVTRVATSAALSLDMEPSAWEKPMPLRAIQAARQTSRRAASISVAMSASLKAMGCWGAVWFSDLDPPAAEVAGGDRGGGAGGGLGVAGLAGPFQLGLEAFLAAEQAVGRDAAVLEQYLGGVGGADA